jgi:excisionase family DNA binding protein
MPLAPVIPLLTVAEVAAALRVQESTVYRWARAGRIESVRVEGVVRIPMRVLEALVSDPDDETTEDETT